MKITIYPQRGKLVKNLIKLIIIACFFAASCRAMEESDNSKKVAAVIDTGIFAPNDDMTTIITNAMSKAPSLFWQNPRLLTNALQINNMAIEISKTTRGITNIITELAKQIKDKGIGELSVEDQEKIIRIAIAPVFNKDAALKISSLHEQGYPVICYTNRDQYEFDICSNLINQKNSVAIVNLYHGLTTLACWKTKEHLNNQPFYAKTKTHAICGQPFPDQSFMDGIQYVAKNIGAEKIVIMPQKQERVNDILQKYPTISCVNPGDFVSMQQELKKLLPVTYDEMD